MLYRLKTLVSKSMKNNLLLSDYLRINNYKSNQTHISLEAKLMLTPSLNYES